MTRGLDVLFAQVDLRPGDRLLIVTDTRSDAEVGRLMYEQAIVQGADASWCQVRARSTNGEDLPRAVIAALGASDLAMLVTSWSATHSPGVISAIGSGVRVLSMPGVRSEMLDQGALTADYEAVRRLTERWGEYFARGSEVRLTTAAGTDLRSDLGGWGRRPFLDDGRLPRGIGGVGNMPAGEVAVAPIEGSTRGRVIADLTLSTTPRPLAEVVEIEIEHGRVVSVTGGVEAGQFAAALDDHGDSSRVVAEIALGTNPEALHIGVVIEDEKRLGSAHVGFGHALGLGGLNSSTIHADAIFADVSMWIDGVELVSSGQVVAEALERENLAKMPGTGGRYGPGPARTAVRDGLAFAAWSDVRGFERWAQVGDSVAAFEVGRLLEAGRFEAEPGSPESRALDLLALYGGASRQP